MSEPYYQDDAVTLYHGDCFDVLRGLPDESVHAVVTDPPYGLGFMGKEWDSGKSFVERKAAKSNTFDHVGGNHNPSNSTDAARTRRVESRKFGDWCEQWTAECLRVLKPGGHMLAFGGTRTWHRMAVAIEDAGFEVRDSIAWMYGSGFPKSLDVSKAIDRRAEVNMETKRRIELVAEVIRTHREAAGLERAEVSRAVVGTPSGACWNWEHQQLPSVEMWPAIKRVLNISDKFDGLVEGDRTQFIAAEREVIGSRTSNRLAVAPGQGMDRSAIDLDVTTPATDAAREWQGWGTALKPSHEPIVVARKPLAGTVAANVLAWGTGALNIDGCRIGDGSGSQGPRPSREATAGTRYTDAGAVNIAATPGPRGGSPNGRWPANVVLDEHAAAELDRQSGESGGSLRIGNRNRAGDGYAMAAQESALKMYGDTGGASRFFPVFKYEPKAPTTERPRDGSTAHPTVKPLDLMRWLVRLVTPPGGTVLDPFAGSGTTAEACIIEGLQCIAIEREADYLPLIVQRLSKPIAPVLDLGSLT